MVLTKLSADDNHRQMFEKLVAIRENMAELPQTGESAGLRYKFHHHGVVARIMGTKLAEQKLFLMSRITNKCSEPHMTKDGSQHTRWIVDMDFGFADVETGLEMWFPWAGESIDRADKALAQSISIAKKTFLMTFFLLGNEEPDGEEHSHPAGVANGATAQPKIIKITRTDTFWRFHTDQNNTFHVFDTQMKLLERAGYNIALWAEAGEYPLSAPLQVSIEYDGKYWQMKTVLSTPAEGRKVQPVSKKE